MALTRLNNGLMRVILDIIRAHGQTKTFDTDWITDRVREKGYWKYKKPPGSPARTVNVYFSQSPDVFEHVDRNQYPLRVDHLQVPEAIHPIAEGEPSDPQRTSQTVFRIIRQTRLIEQLKLIYDNCCQICGLAIQVAHGTYSEGHHVRPRSRKGPDVIENILILCPNHHVLRDYGGIRLDLADIRLDSRHRVSNQYIEWHNNHFFGSEPKES